MHTFVIYNILNVNLLIIHLFLTLCLITLLVVEERDDVQDFESLKKPNPMQNISCLDTQKLNIVPKIRFNTSNIAN